ncbi:hypothetical protein JL722_7863 [Aureococcus anophagefferens]|nr:hypothetical protein JL722_7863 [Aureococcus anophagefferens]
MSLSFRLLDCTFAKPCQYFISLQLDDHKKRLRTKVSDETAKPAFDQVFDLGDFEEDFAELTGATRRLTLDAFVVLGSARRRPRAERGLRRPAGPARSGAADGGGGGGAGAGVAATRPAALAGPDGAASWNEIVVLEAPREPRDGEALVLELVDGAGRGPRRRAAPLAALAPFNGYTFEAPLAFAAGAAPPGAVVAVVQLADADAAEALVHNTNTPFPTAAPPGAPGAPPFAHRKPTLSAPVEDGRAAWDDRVVFPVGALDGAAPVHGDLATYPAALDRAAPSSSSTARRAAGPPRRFLGACALPVARARARARGRRRPPARVGAFAARADVETRGASASAGKETPRTAATPPVAAAARRAATPDAALSTSTDWEPRRARGAATARRTRARFADDVAQKQLAIQRLVGELEARGAALRTCGGEIDALRRRGAALEADKGALAAQIAAAADAKDREWRGLERLLADGGDLERFDGAGAATKTPRSGAPTTRRERKLGDAEARHAHLQRAHTAQSAFIQKLQADRAKVDAYKTTIAMQEQVIAKLEHVVTAKLKEIVDRRQAELALKRDEPPVVAPDPATERKLAAALDEKRGLEFLVEAKDQRVKVLEDQLLVKASEAAQEIAKLNLKIFELEVQQSDTLGRAAPR